MSIELAHPLRLAFGILLSMTLQSTLLLGLAGALALALKRATAATRHFLWLTALIGVLLLPLLQLLPKWSPPAWAVPATPQFEALNKVAFLVTGEVQSESQPEVAAASLTSAPKPADSHHTSTENGHRKAMYGWPEMLVLMWTIGVAIHLARWMVGCWRLRRIAGAAQPPEQAHWIELTIKLSGQLDLRRPVRLLMSDGSLMPMTWGWRSPVVLLPPAARAWPEERLALVLQHELAHVCRGDCLTQSVAVLTCALQWFNPLVWYAARRMRAERELACDDLVLSAGAPPSTYAGHLLEIATQFQTRFAPASLPMARPGDLEQRLRALVAKDQNRGGLSHSTALCIVAIMLLLVCFVGACAKSEAPNAPATATNPIPPHIKAFFANREQLARALEAEARKEDPESFGELPESVWKFFEAGSQGDWLEMTNAYTQLHSEAPRYGGTNAALQRPAFQCVIEAYWAYDRFRMGGEKYSNAFTRDILQSIPEHAVYFGGTDPGLFLITEALKSQPDGDPCFVLTQNSLADMTYLMYLRFVYGPKISFPTTQDSENCFREYYTGAARRLEEGKLKKGEDIVLKDDGRVQASGQVAVMEINALLAKVVFDKNPDRDFYIEESYPLDWMYPHLSPSGLILKVNREPLDRLDEATVQRDQQYWDDRISGMVGDWLNQETSIQEICTFATKVFGKGDFAGFDGDSSFVSRQQTCAPFSKARSAIAKLYEWRMQNESDPGERQRYARAADYAYRQAIALCPYSPDGVTHYANFLKTAGRTAEEDLVIKTATSIKPESEIGQQLKEQLKEFNLAD